MLRGRCFEKNKVIRSARPETRAFKENAEGSHGREGFRKD